MSKVANLVKIAFNKHPIKANSLIYGTFLCAAEASQQTVSKKFLAKEPLPYDKPVLGRCFAYGSFIQGPILSNWYTFLDRILVGTAVPIVIRKLVLDQFLVTPSILVLFYISMSIMENQSDILDECKRKFFPTFKTSCAFWLPAQMVNFLLIPPTFRVVYVSGCSFVWANILCWFKRQDYKNDMENTYNN